MREVLGTSGYEDVVDQFAEASFELSFEDINQDFLAFLPQKPARILDAGSGVGQNAAALSRLGYDVTAVEPMLAFVQIAKRKFQDLDVVWLQDRLPQLETLESDSNSYDFILIDGVWHHLNPDERRECIKRMSSLLKQGGICCISLRNGPAGAGKHIFPTSNEEVSQFANEFGFRMLLNLKNQPSKMKNKENVIWSRVAIEKLANTE